MISKFVAGNDIFISWRILKNQGTNFDSPSVVLYDSFKKKCPLTYEIEDKGTELLVTGKYLGKDQNTFGLYHLVFYNNYNEEGMNTLVYRNAFVLIHSAKRGLTTYGDEDADQSVLVELESDLSVALMNQEITDREEIIQALSDMTLVNDSQNQLLNDISTHLDSSISDLMNRIENISVGDFSQLIGEIEDNEEAITRYLSIIDNSVYLHKMQLFDNSTLIGEVSTRLLYLKNLHVTPLENNVTDISSNLIDLSTYTHNITIPSEYDDSVLKGRIADISTYAINTSSRLNDLSTFAHNITPGSDYDDSELTNKLNDLSTYTHNLVIPSEYDDSALKNRIADVSSNAIDLSTRLKSIEEYQYSVLRDVALYTPFNIINYNLEIYGSNSSAFLFHDVIVNTSSFGSDDVKTPNYTIQCKNMYTGDTANGVLAKITRTTGINDYKYISVHGDEYNIRTYGTYIGDNIFEIPGSWYAYHFGNLMSITRVLNNSSIRDVSNQVLFRLEDPV